VAPALAAFLSTANRASDDDDGSTGVDADGDHNIITIK